MTMETENAILPNRPRRRGLAARGLLGCAAALLGLTLFQFARAVQEEAPAEAGSDGPVGLQGVLPEDVPRDLDFEAFSNLGGNWEQWATETTDEVSRLYYEINQLSLEDQRQILASLERRLKQMDRAIADARYRALYDQLITLQGNLRRRLEVMQAALDTLALDPARVGAQRLETARPDVLSAVSSARSWLQGYRNGETWIRHFRLDELAGAVRDSGAPPEAQEIALTVHDRIQNIDRLADEQQQFLKRGPFDRLKDALAVYVGALRTTQEPGDQQPLRDVLGRLIDAIERYEQDSSIAAAADVRRAYRELRDVAPDGGARVTRALRSHYFNYNLKVVASEQFLNRLVHDERAEAGAVNDRVMGANVYGTQYTWTTTAVDLKPHLTDAKFDLTVRGTVNSNTAGVTSQATVHTVGNHHFWASKEVRFNGFNFTSGPAQIAVDANNRTVDVDVKHGWIPIIGWIAQGIAEREVRRRQPQAEAIARNKIAERVVPEMNREINQALADAEQDIQNDLYVRLGKTGLYPQATSLKTSDQYMWMNYRVWTGGELAGDTLNYTRNQPGGVTIHVHESYLNHMFDEVDFAGRTMTETEVRQELEQYFSTLMGRHVDFSADQPPSPEEGPDIFTFAEQDPIRVDVEAGQINLIIRAAFQQRNGEDIPQQVVTVPLAYRIEGNDIVIDRGTVIVAPADEPPSAAEQIARAGIIRKKLESSIPEQRRSRIINLKRENNEDFAVVINRIVPLNGWVTVWGQ